MAVEYEFWSAAGSPSNVMVNCRPAEHEGDFLLAADTSIERAAGSLKLWIGLSRWIVPHWTVLANRSLGGALLLVMLMNRKGNQGAKKSSLAAIGGDHPAG
ncbi:hypothetical protein B0H13DRAFT_1911846 [Mycena leptocephala]|nr:hypothetical protein B0H13DRAFT_1911846 [Mycena leptocephala]